MSVSYQSEAVSAGPRTQLWRLLAPRPRQLKGRLFPACVRASRSRGIVASSLSGAKQKRGSVSNWRVCSLKQDAPAKVSVIPYVSDTATTVTKEATDDKRDSYQEASDWIDALPSHYRVVATITLAFILCNMDKVNISVAIIPMARDLGWDPSTAGFVQSAFFWGYAAGQLPGGFLSNAFGGKKVLLGGVFLWSAATAALPLGAESLPLLFACRLLTGLGEGVSPPAAVDLIAKTVPRAQRSRATAIVFGGLQVGSILGLLTVPLFIDAFGWPSVFYVFGVAGIGWVLVANSFFGNAAQQEPSSDATSAASMDGDAAGLQRSAGSSKLAAFRSLPWHGFAGCRPLKALTFAHFCNNWGHYTLLAWLPTYYSQTLDLDLQHAALMSLLPPIMCICTSSVAAPLADRLVSGGEWSPTQVRKTMQTCGFMLPALFLGLAAYAPLSPAVKAGFITIGLGLSSFSVAGLYSNHQDMSPRYASVLLGITNTIGALPGVLGVGYAGHILSQSSQDWNSAMFLPTIFFYLAGTVIYNVFGDASEYDFHQQPTASKALPKGE